MSLHLVQLGPVPPPEGGISRNIAAIRKELLSRGHRCSVVATSKSSIICDDPDVYHPGSAAKLIQQIRALKPDILHLHIGGEVVPRVLALASAVSMLASKTILSLHSGAFPLSASAKRASRRSATGLVLRKFSHLIAVNDAIADVFRRYGISGERISVILPHSLEPPDMWIELPTKLREFAASHSPFLVSVGGLEEDYDPIFQIASMRAVLDKMPNAGLMIVGNGSMQPAVEAAVSHTGYSERVMLAGNIPHAETLHMIDRADVLLRTSLFDGDAISVREGLFLGTPVVATDNGMRPDGVRLIARGDTMGLVRHIEEAFEGGKPGGPPQSEPHNANIRAVVEMYESLF